MSPGNDVRLLVDGKEAFPEMLEAIGAAERTLLMDSYIFNQDGAGQIFADALIKAAGRGVRVHLIVDGVGTLYVPGEFFEEFRREGVRVLEYRPVAPWRRGWGLLRRNHRKLLVVDNRIGFAGGVNVGDQWLPREMEGLGWHDIHVRVEGPAVRELSKLALSTWQSHGKEPLPVGSFLAPVKLRGKTPVHIVGSREKKKRKAIRQAYLHAIKRARRYVYIANAYFLPGRGYRRALANAVRRGGDVRIMVPERGDIVPVQLASQAIFGRLLRRGVRLFLWRDAVLHAKAAVIDDQWATVGSFNLDHRSWAMNLEVNVNVLGEPFAGGLRRVFERDQEQCRELTREEWRRRPVLLRLLERFCYQFRKLM